MNALGRRMVDFDGSILGCHFHYPIDDFFIGDDDLTVLDRFNLSNGCGFMANSRLGFVGSGGVALEIVGTGIAIPMMQ